MLRIAICLMVFSSLKAYAGGCEMACDGDSTCLQECKRSKDAEDASKKAKPKQTKK